MLVRQKNQMLMAILMKIDYFLSCFLIYAMIGFSSCNKSFKEGDKIFHGAPDRSGIGGLSFGLYKDKRYMIMNSGGIAWFEYSGRYDINGDTIVLHNLDKELNKEFGKGVFESNRLVIYRYNEQDSTFWEWKYSDLYKSFTADRKLGTWLWEDYKRSNEALGEGDVYQVDLNGKPIKSAYHFIIRLDSLKYYP
jgi:hypothetical protein